MIATINRQFFYAALIKIRRGLIWWMLAVPASFTHAASMLHNPYLVEAPVNLQDKVALQRGAQIFSNNCVGCHSAKFMRYERIADDLGIPSDVMVDNFLVGGVKIGDTMMGAMTEKNAKTWFGAQPPDLSLTARLRGADWLYSYLIGFYPDNSRPWGYNNHIFDKVGMPHVLENMSNRLGEENFRRAMADLTGFMVYIAEPARFKRERMGPLVLLFIIVFGAFAYALNKEYWKDIK